MRFLKALLVGGLLLWGLLALLVRATTPLIADYRDDLAALLSERLEVPVRIGALRARWYGFSPLLEMTGVRVGAAPNQLEVARVVLSPTPAALAGKPLIQSTAITVEGLRLTAIREPDGGVHLQGVGLLQGGGDAAPQLPRQLRLVDTEVTWVDRLRGTTPVVLEDVAASLQYDDGLFQIRAGVQTRQGRAFLAADIDGDPTGTAWRGQSYLRVENLDVARVLGVYLPDAYRLHSMHLDLESWGAWEAARPVRAQGRFDVRDLHLQGSHAPGGALAIPELGASFESRHEGGRLQLGLHDLSIRFPGGRWPVGEVALALQPDAPEGYRVDLSASYLRMEDLSRALQVRLPASGLAEPLTQVAPHGEVRDLRLQFTHRDDAVDWRVTAKFAEVATEPWQEVPGVRGLQGRLLGRHGHVVLELATADATLRFVDLFRNPIELRRLDGRVDLTFAGGAWQVRSDLLVADTPHFSSRTRLWLDQQPGESLFVDLQSEFRDGDAAFAGLYYPTAIMGKGLVRWLDRSIPSGRIVSGSALVYGPTDDFAFEKTMSGVFRATLDTEDLVLDYKQGWPGMRELDAQLHFAGNHLDIRSQSASIYDSRVVEVEAHIASLQPTAPLQVRGRLDGPLRNNLQVLREDALAPRFGAFADTLAGDGDTQLLLDFQVPLKDLGEYALDGELRFDGNRLRVPDYDLDIDDVRGTLAFTLDGLHAEGIEARALGTAVSVDVSPQADGTTRVRTRGQVGYDALADQFGFLPPALAVGTSAYVVDVEVPPRRAASTQSTLLRVASELRDTELRLPAPFGKAADEARALTLTLPLGDEAATGTLAYADLVGARFTANGERVALAFASPPPALPATTGVSIGGRLAEVDVAEWQHALADLGGPDDPGRPVAVDLNIDRLRLDGLSLDALTLQAQRRQGAWSGDVSAAQLDGDFRIPAAPARAPVEINLARLHLALPVDTETPPQGRDASPPDPAAGPDPRDLPGLRLVVADLRLNEADLGRLRLLASPVEQGLQLDEISLYGGQLDADAGGAWSVADDGFGTRLAGWLETADLGALVAGLGYSPQVADAGGRVDWELAWSGHPAQPHVATLTGDLSLDIGAGRLTEVEPGVGRIVGLLNLNALTRRLRLDFTDLYEKGFAFDSIRGDFNVDAGRATTDNLAIEGPSGRLLLDGATDLPTRTLDQHVTVYPDATATLPIAGTLAGGPVAGLAVLVAQGVMAKQVDDINRFEYRVAGPWDRPEVEQLQSGGALSKLVAPITEFSRRLGTGDDAEEQAAPDERPPGPGAQAAADTTAVAAQPASPTPGDLEAQEPADPVEQTLRGVVDFLQEQRDGPDARPEMNP